MRAFARVCLFLCALPLCRLAQAEETGLSRYAQAVMVDKPAAYWRLNELRGKSVADAAASEPVFGGKVAGVTLGRPGPQTDRFPDFESGNLAAAFDAAGARVVFDDATGPSALKFGDGDSITLEAWVSLNHIEEGQQIYVVGKGRTGNAGFAKENQNYALRLRGVPDGGTSTATISFLFRDADNRPSSHKEYEKDWHRWTSHASFLEGSGWHHIAVTYTFGRGKSMRGYIDGVEVDGTWDMGGVSDQPPVVDDDQVWIGSALGGSKASTFDGLIDEVAIYRTALTPEQLSKHYRANAAEAEIAPLAVKPGEVLVQIREGVPDKRDWNFSPPRLTEQYIERSFAFVGVPQKYSNKALLADRSSPFLITASGRVDLPAGKHRLLLRSRGAARVYVDGKLTIETPFQTLNSSGHEEVPELPAALEPEARPLPVGHAERLVEIELDGQPHDFKLECIVGGRGLRPDLGELCVSIAGADQPLALLSQSIRLPLTDANWLAYATEQRMRLEKMNHVARQSAGAEETKYWALRHDLARQHVGGLKAPDVPERSEDRAALNEVDRFINHKAAPAGRGPLRPAAAIDDATFLRRLSLDTIGVIPSGEEVAAYFQAPRAERRQRAIERLLTDSRWADHWTSYWQDVLAENPGLLKPQLNNTGPFRWWIYESFVDNKPIDRFVTELVMMEGSRLSGGPAGFAMATQNDSPMAAKGNIVAKASLGVEMQCARCHDAPYHPVKQKDTFGLAAMLARAPLKVPTTSTVPFKEGAREPLVKVTLKPGSTVQPIWPFEPLVDGEVPAEVLRQANDPRERLAAILTSPTNERFAQVMVNRMWKRYLGRGLVEPVDDWTHADPSHPELLSWLGRQLMTHDYDLKHVARLIFSSHTYQRVVEQPKTDDDTNRAELFATPTRRRLSAEQMVDSLFLAVGKEFHSEELNLDPDCRRPQADFLNLGQPRRAWQFVSLSNERDRPALALPVAQSIVDLLISFGWRESRQNPLTLREENPTVLQPLMLAHGVVGNRISRLSEDSRITELSLEDKPVNELVQAVYRQVLSRDAAADEEALFVELLSEGYADRRIVSPGSTVQKAAQRRTTVSWSNHLSPEATRIKLELERAARAGDPPTQRLQTDWRERMEDMLWALVNSPEFAFVP